MTVQRLDGTTLTSYNGPITLTLRSDSGTPGAVLSGTTVVTAVNGVATFGTGGSVVPLSIDQAGQQYVLSAKGTLLDAVDSQPFNVGTPTAYATLQAYAGSGQFTPVSTAFASLLVARVITTGGTPLSGVVVTFHAPASGASGTFAGGASTYQGTTDASGFVTATVFTANATAGSYSVTADAPGVSNQALFNLTNQPSNQPDNTDISLSLNPAFSGPNPVSSTVLFTATLTKHKIVALANQSLTFVVVDKATQQVITSTTRQTSTDGTAAFSYSSSVTGTHFVTVSATINGRTILSNQANVYWVSFSHPVATSRMMGYFYPPAASLGVWVDPLSTDQPLFTQTLAGPLFNPVGGWVTGLPSQLNYNANPKPIVNVATDAGGNFTGFSQVQGNGYALLSSAYGKNDLVSGFRAVFTGYFEVAQSGIMTFSVFNDNHFILGVGADQVGHTPTCVAPCNQGSATTFLTKLPEIGFSAITDPNQSNPTTFSVNFPAPGIYPYEINWAGDQNYDSLGLLDVTNKALPVGVSLTISPTSDSASPIQKTAGTNQTFTVKATGPDGNGLPYLDVALSIVGTNLNTQPVFVTTGPDGTATYTYTSQNSGTDTVQATAWLTGLPLNSNRATVQWFCGPSPSSVFSDSFSDLSNWQTTNAYEPTGAVASWTVNNNILSASLSSQADVIAYNSNFSIGNSFTYDIDFTPQSTNARAGFGLYSTSNGSTVYRFIAGFDNSGNSVVYMDKPHIGTPINQNASSGINFTVGTTYHFRLKALSSSSYQFSINNVPQFVYTDSSLASASGNLALVGAGGNFDLQNLVVSNDYPGTPPANSICGGGDSGPNPSNGCTINNGWLVTPSNPSTVSGQVPIILSNGVTLPVGAVIQVYPVSQPTYSAMITLTLPNGALPATGNGTTPLTSLDTTLLANGSYILRLAYTQNGKCQSSLTLIRVVGENKPGRVTFSLTDFSVPVAGTPVIVGRTYDSLDRNRTGDFGNGWSLSIGDPNLEVNPAGDVTFNTPQGKRVTFFFTPSSSFFGFGAPIYTAEAGVYGSVTLPPGECLTVTPISSGGYLCFPGPIFNPSSYNYRDPYGRLYTFAKDTNGKFKLKSLLDLNGNQLVYDKDGIKSVNNGTTPNNGDYIVKFIRPTSGCTDCITQITTTLGYSYYYTYTPSASTPSTTGYDLTQVGLPAVITPTTYTYYTGNQAHFFKNAVDSRGNEAVFTQYYVGGVDDGRLQSVRDAVGNTTSYNYTRDLPSGVMTTTVTNPTDTYGASGTITLTYDSYGKVTSEADPLNRQANYSYDARHQMTSRTDPTGTTNYEYDSSGNQTVMTNTLGQLNKISYGPFRTPGQVTDTYDPASTVIHTWNVSYNSNFLPLSVSDSLGTSGGYDFDARGSILTRYDAKGQGTGFTYDAYGNKATETDPYGATTRYGYDTLGRMTFMTNALGIASKYEYDGLGRLITSTEAYTTSKAARTVYGYDGNGNRIKTTDPNLHVTNYAYDKANRLTSVQYADNTSVQYGYDWRGNVITTTDQALHVTLNRYDQAGQLISTTVAFGTPDAATTLRFYDTAGRVISLTNPYRVGIDPAPAFTLYQYDAMGHVLAMINTVGYTNTFTYDAEGNKASETDGKGHTTTYGYDLRHRLITTTYPSVNGQVFSTLNGYDPNGQIITATDGAGLTTNYQYDKAQRLVSVAIPITQSANFYNTTAYRYDALGNLRFLTDSKNHTTEFRYDELNQQTDKILPDSSFEHYTYDAVGNRKSVRLTDGNTNTFGYDALDRLQTASYFDGQSFGYGYTPTGQRLSVTDTRGTTSYFYDNRDRVIRIVQPASLKQEMSFTYDALSNRKTMTTLVTNTSNVGTSSTTNYTYSAANQLLSLKAPYNSVPITYHYDSVGLRDAMNLPNGVINEYSYDNLNRLVSLYEHTGAASVVKYVYTYTPGIASNKQRVDETWGDPANPTSKRTVKWTYDDAYRLTQEADTALSGITTTFGYDTVGNRLRMSVTNGTSPAQTTSYQYNELDQLQTILPASGGSIQYSYDRRGNLKQVGSGSLATSFGYDALNRLTSATTPTSTLAYGYDPDGHRVKQTASSTVTNYLWDTEGGYGNVALETDSSNNLAVSYELGGHCCHTLNEVTAQKRGSAATNYYLYDGQSNVRALSNDTTGSVTDRYNYNAFGELLSDRTGSTTNNYLYGGQQFDPITGLYSLRARYYNPGTGRFNSRDSFAIDFQNPVDLNRYAYTSNNPTSYSDPTGYLTETPTKPAPTPTQEEAGGDEESLAYTEISLGSIVFLIAFGLAVACTLAFETSYFFPNSTAALSLFFGLCLYNRWNRSGTGSNGSGSGGNSNGSSSNNGSSNPCSPGSTVLTNDIYSFYRGGKPGQIRPGIDIEVDDKGNVKGQGGLTTQKGASTFNDPNSAPLSGKYDKLPAGTVLPPGIGVIADGQDVNPASDLPAGHHTLYPCTDMAFTDFQQKLDSLPWQAGGRKK